MKTMNGVLIAVLVVGGLLPGPSAVGQNWKRVYEKALRGFVTVKTDYGTGSGFFADSARLVTNRHVLAGAVSATLTGSCLEKPLVVSEFCAIDSLNDIIIIHLPDYRHPHPLDLAKHNPDVGEAICALGSPMGFDATFTPGMVSGFRTLDGAKVIQISAAVDHGSSGGPVLNSRSEVVGIVVSGMKDAQNLNFAVPVEVFARVNGYGLRRLAGLRLTAEERQQCASRDFRLGQEAFGEKNWERAEDFLRRSLWRDSTLTARFGLADALFWNKKARVSFFDYAKQQKYTATRSYRLKEARQLVLTALTDALASKDLDSEQPMRQGLYLLLARIQAEVGNYPAALAAFESLAELTDLGEIVGQEVEAVQKAMHGQKAADWLNRAKAATKPGDKIDLATRSITEWPLTEAYYIRAVALSPTNLAGAILNLDSAVALQPNHMLAVFYRAYYCAQTGQYQRAVVDYARYTTLNSADWGGWNNWANALISLRQYGPAEVKATEAIRLAPGQKLGYRNRGEARLRQGNIPGALDDLNKAFAIDPTDVTIKSLLKETANKL